MPVSRCTLLARAWRSARTTSPQRGEHRLDGARVNEYLIRHQQRPARALPRGSRADLGRCVHADMRCCRHVEGSRRHVAHLLCCDHRPKKIFPATVYSRSIFGRLKQVFNVDWRIPCGRMLRADRVFTAMRRCRSDAFAPRFGRSCHSRLLHPGHLLAAPASPFTPAARPAHRLPRPGVLASRSPGVPESHGDAR